MNKITTQPVALGAAVVTLITAVLPVLLMFGVSPDIVEKIGISAPGIVVAIGAIVHNLVTPSAKVALTHADVAAINAAKPLPAPFVQSLTYGAGGGGGGYATGGSVGTINVPTGPGGAGGAGGAAVVA